MDLQKNPSLYAYIRFIEEFSWKTIYHKGQIEVCLNNI